MLYPFQNVIILLEINTVYKVVRCTFLWRFKTGILLQQKVHISANSFNGILQLVEIRNSINYMKIYSF